MPRRATPAPEATAAADALHSAAIHLLRRLRRVDDRSGLSAPRLSALSVLVFGGPCTLGALAAAEQVRPPTMSRLVDGLAADGLAERVADPADARRTVVRATAAGARVLRAGRARRVAALAAAIGALSESERATLARAAALMERLAAPAGG